MKIQAIYENGVLRPTQALNLKRKLVTIQIPDEAIDFSSAGSGDVTSSGYTLTPEARRIAEEMQARLERIRNAPFPPDEDLPRFTQKHLERIEAFAAREDG